MSQQKPYSILPPEAFTREVQCYPHHDSFQPNPNSMQEFPTKQGDDDDTTSCNHITPSKKHEPFIRLAEECVDPLFDPLYY
ncbi:hypothetical protein TNCV_2190401 [Trichonephila clavipes]|uniref:Uncharacterized protein n=1 Tax=Trichonephila clavipes TaxID=2585209 RepID=A0A8X6UZN4_TRICX|nr:hypothetical protein TNCV_2190401 [Trichonephila clavipes]